MVVLEGLAAFGLYKILFGNTTKEGDAEGPQCPLARRHQRNTATAADAAGSAATQANIVESTKVHVSHAMNNAEVLIRQKLAEQLESAMRMKGSAEKTLAAALEQNNAINDVNTRLKRDVKQLQQQLDGARGQEAKLLAELQGLKRRERCLVGAAQATVLNLLIHAPLIAAVTSVTAKLMQLQRQGRLQVRVDWRAIARSFRTIRVDAPSARYQPTRSPATELDCTICHANQRDVLLLPCRHLAICWPCSEALVAAGDEPQCPLCRQRVTGIQYAVVA